MMQNGTAIVPLFTFFFFVLSSFLSGRRDNSSVWFNVQESISYTSFNQ